MFSVSPEWIRLWAAKSPCCANDLPQSHANGFSPIKKMH